MITQRELQILDSHLDPPEEPECKPERDWDLEIDEQRENERLGF